MSMQKMKNDIQVWRAALKFIKGLKNEGRKAKRFLDFTLRFCCGNPRLPITISASFRNPFSCSSALSSRPKTQTISTALAPPPSFRCAFLLYYTSLFQRETLITFYLKSHLSFFNLIRLFSKLNFHLYFYNKRISLTYTFWQNKYLCQTEMLIEEIL